MPETALTTLGAVKPGTRQVATEVLRAAEAAGHRLATIWGYNPASKPEHSAGLALDFMCTRTAGDFIADYLWANRGRLGVRWVLWRRRIRSTSPGKPTSWQPMADRGSVTQNHEDHVHVFLTGAYSPPTGDPASPKPAVADAQVIGEQLVRHGFGRHYQVGPSPTWSAADDANLREFELIVMGREPRGLDDAARTALAAPLFTSSVRHAVEYHTPIDVRLVKFATLKLGIAPPDATRSPAWWNADLGRSDRPDYDPGRWYVEAQLNYQVSIGDPAAPPLGPLQYARLGRDSGLFHGVA